MPSVISFTVPDADVAAVVEWAKVSYPVQWAAAQAAGTPVGAFTRACVIQHLTEAVRQQRDGEVILAAQAAQQAVPPPAIV
jgi:hypothetical protein